MSEKYFALSDNITKFKRLQEQTGHSKSIVNLAKNRIENCNNLYCRDLFAHYGCVNAVEFSNRTQEFLASGGDDKRVLLWNLGEALLRHNYKPVSMIGTHISNIFCIAFDVYNNKLFSSGNDEQVLVHDIATRQAVNVYLRDDAVYSLSAHPNDVNIFATASEDGKIRVTDMRLSSHCDTMCLANCISAFHGVVFNPMEPLFVASAHSAEGVCLWDVRKPKSVLLRYGEPNSQESAMSVRFNEDGSQLAALRRRNTPAVYITHNPTPIVEFSRGEYLNSCTMKSGCFAGETDEYVVSGSDDFKIYIWKIPLANEGASSSIAPTSIPSMVLQGHRSIVNQVRYNKETQTLVSSGVEKSIKMWSPFEYPGFTGQIDKPSTEENRTLYSRHEYIDLVLQSGMTLTHDYEGENMREDPRMMAFFDSLLQHDRNHSSESSSDDGISELGLLPAIIEESNRDLNDAIDTSRYSSDDSLNIAFSNSAIERERPNHPLPPETFAESNSNRSALSRLLLSDLDNIDELGENSQPNTSAQTQKLPKFQPLPENASLSTSLQTNDSGIVWENNNSNSSVSSGEKQFKKLAPCTSKTDDSKFRKNTNAAKRRKLKLIVPSDSDSGCDDAHSNVRRKNAMRKRKDRSKWMPQAKTDNLQEAHTEPPSTLGQSCSSCGNDDTNKKSSDSFIEKNVEESSCHSNAFSEMSPYERSRTKLLCSIEATELKFASIADRLASALEDVENNHNKMESPTTVNDDNESGKSRTDNSLKDELKKE